MEIIHHIERARWLCDETYAIEIAGWCFLPTAELAAVEAYVGTRRIAVSALQNRPDVQQFHGLNPHALRSGFTLLLPLLELEDGIELRVGSQNRSVTFYSARAGDLPDRGAIILNYSQWSAASSDRASLAPSAANLSKVANSGPLVSLLLPVFNTPPKFLSEAVGSVIAQSYPHWELRIVDDGSTRPDTSQLLDGLPQRDSRISISRVPKNSGISRATNLVLEEARGEFVGFIDHDDRLLPTALADVIERFTATGADAVYTDEEKITAEGIPCAGIFKPAFSPEFLRGVMYVGHFLCVRTSAAHAVGGLNPQFDGIQDFEFILRLAEYTPRIEHLRKVLYQWRVSLSSSARDGNVKGDMDQRQLEAVEQHLKRTGRRVSAKKLGAHRVHLHPAPNPRADRNAVVVRDERWLDQIPSARECAVSVLSDPTLETLVGMLQDIPHERILWVNEPLTFLQPDAISTLLGFLDEPDVSVIAPTLLARDGKIFASGAIISPSRQIVPAMRGFSNRSDGYNGSLVCNREVSAVLSACVGLRRTELLACLTASTHPGSDRGMAELCVKLLQQGRRIVNCAAIQVGTQRDWAGQQTLGEIGAAWTDPYFNGFFDGEKGDYRLCQRS